MSTGKSRVDPPESKAVRMTIVEEKGRAALQAKNAIAQCIIMQNRELRTDADVAPMPTPVQWLYDSSETGEPEANLGDEVSEWFPAKQ
jgi:hypothetical protein